jgi:hypothetical protein
MACAAAFEILVTSKVFGRKRTFLGTFQNVLLNQNVLLRKNGSRGELEGNLFSYPR